MTNRYNFIVLTALLLSCTLTSVGQTKPAKSAAATVEHKRINVYGLVLDDFGVPLPGATVILRGTTQGLTTDAEGRFVIQIPVQESMILDISFIGMKQESIKVTKSDKFTIRMKQDNKHLEEVVVNGFFRQDKKTFTGAASTLKGDQLLQVSTTNPIKAIAALTPGMHLVENNAAGSNPNAIPDIIIRGTTSLVGDAGVNSPLVILDGTEITLEELYDLDIYEIETVNVLKDASATILYGERASNGVIVVERKRVENTKVQLSYNFTPGLSYPDLSSMNLTNASQKLELERLAGLYDKEDGSLDQAYAYKLANIRRGVNTRWIEAPLRMPFSHNHSLNMSGKGQNLDYRATMKFGDNYGVMKGDNRRSYNLGFYFGYHLTNQLTISYRANYSMTSSRNSPYGSFSDYTKLNPYEPIYDENGDFIKNYYFDPFNPNGSYTKMANPLYNATLSSFSTAQNQGLSNTLDARWDITKTFYVSGQFNLKLNNGQSDDYTSPDDSKYLSTTKPIERGEYRVTGRNGNAWDGKLVVSYRRPFGNGSTALSLNGGADIARDYSSNYVASAVGFMKDQLNDIKFALSYPTNGKPSGGENISARIGFFANANFVLNNRYFADLSYRSSGSSKFGANHRFAPFWSTGLGWNLHNESFMRRDWLNTLRLRWSMGYTGSVNFPYYQAITTYKYDQGNIYYTGMGAIPITMGNPDLKWQKTLNNNIGITASMFDNRLNLTFDYYQQNTFDLLMPIDLPWSVGVDQVKVNFGEIRNSGVDFSLSGQIFKNKNFYWMMSWSGGYNFDKISKISNALEKSNYASYTGVMPKLLFKEGGSQYDIYAVRSAGIDPATGQEIFITKEGNYTFEYDEKDKVAVGNTNPWLQGAWSNAFQFSGVSINITSQYTLGGDIYNSTLYQKVENIDPYSNVDVRAFTDRWKNPGDLSRYLGLNVKKEQFYSERFVERQNEIYISNITVSYDFKADFLKKIKLKRLTLGFSFDDVVRFSTVKYERGTSYPYCRNINLIFRPTF